jgi:tRNA pseudouridine38-40 synthase
MIRHTWKLTIEYDGSRYAGWQEQINARTITGELRKAAQDFLGRPAEIQGSGRTDAGVHALAQVAHLRASTGAPPHPDRLAWELNDRLPADIAVLACEAVPPTFHARHDAIARSYVYRIARRKTAFAKKYVWWVKQPLDLAEMSAAAGRIAGRHDFTCFRAPDPTKPKDSAFVVVNSSSLTETADTIEYRIEASHFLWRMVRRLAGALVRTGAGEIRPDQWKGLLEGDAQNLDIAAWTAPASGLFLEAVVYPGTSRAREARKTPVSGRLLL